MILPVLYKLLWGARLAEPSPQPRQRATLRAHQRYHVTPTF